MQGDLPNLPEFFDLRNLIHPLAPRASAPSRAASKGPALRPQKGKATGKGKRVPAPEPSGERIARQTPVRAESREESRAPADRRSGRREPGHDQTQWIPPLTGPITV